MIELIEKDILCIYNDVINFKDLNRLEKHNLIQEKIVKLAQKYGYIGKDELFIQVESWGNRKGYIDVAWYNNDILEFAIEIDSSFREKSVQKLSCVKSKNKIWFCYSKKELKFKEVKKQDINNDIYYITPNI